MEAVVETMRAEHDPLAPHIFISRRHYRNSADTKGGTRREKNARLSFNAACDLGFLGSLDEWERLMGSIVKRYVRSWACRAVALLRRPFCVDS